MFTGCLIITGLGTTDLPSLEIWLPCLKCVRNDYLFIYYLKVQKNLKQSNTGRYSKMKKEGIYYFHRLKSNTASNQPYLIKYAISVGIIICIDILINVTHVNFIPKIATSSFHTRSVFLWKTFKNKLFFCRNKGFHVWSITYE